MPTAPNVVIHAHAHVPADVTGTAVITTDARLSDARTATAHTHAAADVTGTAVTRAGDSNIGAPLKITTGAEGFGIGKASFNSSGQNAVAVTGGGGATQLGVSAATQGAMFVIVVGRDAANTLEFMDQIWFREGPPASAGVLVSTATLGAPAARTYGITSVYLTLAIAGATNYNVRCAVISVLA